MRAATCGLAREISRRGRREYRATVCVNDATRAGRLANHNVVAIAPQKNIKAALGSVLNKDSSAVGVVIQGFRIEGGLDEEATLLAERCRVEAD
jgi:hypothetical protein